MVNIKHLLLATRPSFLLITILGCFIGILLPQYDNSSWVLNALSIAVALAAHAGANLINDYYDHVNGSDAINEDRISPFTGGSRFIQDKIVSPSLIIQTAVFLIVLATALGIYICSITTPLMIPIGVLGVLIAWAYSAPPLQLMSRGLYGELAIAVAWSLIIIGFSLLETSRVTLAATLIGLSFGLMVSNILLVNQVPDIKADISVHKYTLATKYPANTLRNWYTGFYGAAYLLQLFAVILTTFPGASLITVVLIPLFASCSSSFISACTSKTKLKELIIQNLIGVHLYAALLCLSLILTN